VNWRNVSVGEVCDLSTGGTPSKENNEYFDHGDILWLVSGDIHKREIFDCSGRITELGYKNSNAKFLPIDSVLIALNGQGKTRGTVALLRVKATCNQSIVAIAPKNKDELDSKYLFYYLDGKYEYIRRLTGDSGNDRRGLNMPLIRKISLPLPPLSTQKKIVTKLDAIFAEIDKATSAAEANAKNAEALFESYLAQVFENTNDEWNESELGKITKFIDYRGKTPTKTSDGIRLITAKNVKFGFLNGEPYEYISEKDYEGWMTRGIPKKGDVLFTTEAPLANVAQLDTDEKVVFAQRLIILQPQEKTIDSEFLKFSLLSRKVQNKIISKGTGATVKGIKASLLKLIPIEYPSLNRQREICKVLADIKTESNKLKDYYTRKVLSLNLYKNSILKQAFSGELVKE
jgi:type I restriction enzyme S subunit